MSTVDEEDEAFLVFLIVVSEINPPKSIVLVHIPKSKAAVNDSPVTIPEKGIGKEGIVLVTPTPTVVTFNGIVSIVKSLESLSYFPVFRYTYVILITRMF